MTEEERREFVIRRDNYYGQIRAFRDRRFVSERTRCVSPTTVSPTTVSPTTVSPTLSARHRSEAIFGLNCGP